MVGDVLATPNRNRKDGREMQKWEYCELWSGAEKYVLFYTINGWRKVPLSDNEEVAKYIAKLGEEGWEMCTSISGSPKVYFKRPKL